MNARLDMPELGRMLPGVPAADYHRREVGVASCTAMKLLLAKSPAHLRAWYADKDEAGETHALAFGRAYHMRVLEPELFGQHYQRAPDFGDLRSSTNRKARDEYLAERPGVALLSAADADRIEAMHAALLAHPVAAGIMRRGQCEVTMRWTDDETGVECKARADWWVPGKFFMDLKTTDDASPEGFRRAIAKYGYHVQHAHYCDGARLCGETIKHYLILAQEKEPPYVPAVYHIDVASEERGYALRDRALRSIAECMASGKWPGYGDGITEISLPSWALQD